MKRRIFVLILFITASFSVWTQDQITMRDGTTIEVKITEITPSEIKYKRLDYLDGPVIVISRESVLSIRYENGIFEIINAETSTTGQARVREELPPGPAINPDILTFAVNANPGGALSNIGSSVCFEINKGALNANINFIFPSLGAFGPDAGFGMIAAFNYFWHHRIGGLYLGGGLGYIFTKTAYKVTVQYSNYTHTGTNITRTAAEERIASEHYFNFGLNVGYKFITKSGIYFRTGIYLGAAVFGDSNYNKYNNYVVTQRQRDARGGPNWIFVYQPDLTVGYYFN
jgi:hypothetical protein